MKTAFSTIGCPDWNFNEIYAAAKDLKFDGIEIRGIANELYLPALKAFSSENIENTKKKLAGDHLKISMLTSGITLGVNNEHALDEAKEYINTASVLSVPYIRVMLTSHPEPEKADIKAAVRIYNAICAYGEDKNVTPLIETNGILADSCEAQKFIEQTESINKGILWDIHHPFRFFNEQPLDTFAHIGKYVKYVHVKDSVMKDSKVCYRMMGYGDVPVFDAIKLLKESGYGSYISLEWVKRWNRDLEEPGIVFAHFKNYIDFLYSRI